MDTRQLSHFRAVLEARGYARAAAALSVSRTVVLQSIRALEREHGVRLVRSVGGQVVPTPAGDELLPYARTIAREAERAEAQVLALRGNGRGRLVVGVLSPFATPFLARALNEFVGDARNPHLDLFVSTLPPDAIAAHIRQADWDVALTLVPDRNPYGAEVAVRELRRMESGVFCGRGHPLAGARAVTADQLLAHPWVISNLASAMNVFAPFRTGPGAEAPDVRVQTDSMPLISELLDGGAMLGIAPELVMRAQLEEGSIARVDQNVLSSSSVCALLYSSLIDRTPGMRSLISTLHRYVNAL